MSPRKTKVVVFWCITVLFFGVPLVSRSFEMNESEQTSMKMKILDKSLVTQGTNLETSVYPGYTMTFKVAVTSFQKKGNSHSPKFIYSIVDLENKVLLSVSESRIVHEGEVFSKSITLPTTLEEGQYKLKIEATLGKDNYTEERFFSVEKSPIKQFSAQHMGIIKNSVVIVAVILFIIFLVVVSKKLKSKKSKLKNRNYS